LTLADSQKAAVATALASKVLVVTGGPGVGKTTIVMPSCVFSLRRE
jgi:exodeoxyribonuclease V alpha subunit